MTSVDLKPKTDYKFEKPKEYAVVFYNDEYSEMDFVVHLLQQYFGHDFYAANRLMLQVHQEGSAVAGVFSYDVAEHKALRCMEDAKKAGQPLIVMPEELT